MKNWLIAAAAVTALTLPAHSLDVDGMSDAEREAFRAEIRQYLLENPEVIMEAVAVLEQREAEQQAQADVALVAANEEALFEDTHSWVGGNPNGDITLVEFIDYRCGFCRRAHPEIENLLETDGNIRLIVKEFPILGEDSVTASRFAIAVKQLAGNENYKAVHDALIALPGEVSEPALRRLSDAFDLPTDDILAHMESDDVTEVIASNHALAQRLRISGTPTFVMQTQMLRGFVPADDMLAIAEDLRSE
ncbi:DsbA family protein [Roseovarius rhodophyticola]|uniref:DsbA family protein n=1 Tax=Roseovarius rhodophyticola TaxID=3080827 RepID=A0ABZ2TF34_9RHOB|nr:DsbA family protein [Roseovarius sp. W115]MDV2928509.1 DsbA family protein [Roseovarius sp. W115]